MRSHSPEQSAIASQLAAELADYDERLRQLLQEHWDPELYRTLSDLFDRMQMQAQVLPSLTASWTELLISRVDLIQTLWSLATPTRTNGRVVAYHAQHSALIQDVRRKCMEYVGAAD